MNKRKKKTLIWVVVALVVVIAGIFSFGNFGKQKEQTVTVGVVSPSKQDEAVWNQVKKTAKSKYNVDIKLEPLPYEHIRWIENPEEIDVNRIVGTSDMKKIKDLKDNPLLIFVNSWSVNMVLERNEGLKLSEFGKNN